MSTATVDFFFYLAPAPALAPAPQDVFEQDVKKFIEYVTRNLPASARLSFVSFLQHFNKRPGSPGSCRALLKISLPQGTPCPDLGILRPLGLGHVQVHPAHQFAMQALMGGNLNLLSQCGLAFLDTVNDPQRDDARLETSLKVCYDSLDEYLTSFAFHNIRNIFAHSTEDCFPSRQHSGQLLRAAKQWCFTGTALGADPTNPSPFWENSDVLSYIFSATPLSYFFPLCYQAVCAKMNRLKSTNSQRRNIIRVQSNSIICDALVSVGPRDNYVVTFGRTFGRLKKGIAYHVIKAGPNTVSPFSVCLLPGGAPIPIDAIPPEPTIYATFRKCTDSLEEAAVLGCMPSAQSTSNVPSLLDSYFNYNIPLEELMSQLEDGYRDGQLFAPFTSEKTSKNQHGDFTFRNRFAELRRAFNDKLSGLFALHRSRYPHEDPLRNWSLWCHDYAFSIDTSPQQAVPAAAASGVWLGLSKVHNVGDQGLSVRIPKAVKPQGAVASERAADFQKLLSLLKTGDHIASATKHHVHRFTLRPNSMPEPLNIPDGFDDAGESRHVPGLDVSEQWLFEAGICTLKELFQNGVLEGERETLVFRDLMRQIFHSMALAVSRLHECKVVHNGIEASYFKIFPIWESSIQRLRVKLVGLKKVDQNANYQKDVRDLGIAMCWIATVRHNPHPDDRDFATQLQSLKSYDPSLYFLIAWMTNMPAPSTPPTMQEVLRHPYFMSAAQRQTFGIAIGSGMIGAYLCRNPHANHFRERDQALCLAIRPELENHLNHQLALMFDATTAALASGGGVGGGGAGGGGAGANGGAGAGAGAGGAAVAAAAAAAAAGSAGRNGLSATPQVSDQEKRRQYLEQERLLEKQRLEKLAAVPPLAAATPAVVTPAVVTPAVVTPAVVTPAAVTPAVVTPAAVQRPQSRRGTPVEGVFCGQPDTLSTTRRSGATAAPATAAPATAAPATAAPARAPARRPPSVHGMVREIQVGETYDVSVVRIMDFGCFVEVSPGKQGMVHISELSNSFVSKVEDVVQVGDSIRVKCISVDDLGRFKCSLKAAK